MRVWGISARSHDAALAVFEEARLLFAGHAERYSRVKNDAQLCEGLVADARRFGDPDRIVYYERPGLKRLRQLWAGQWSEALTLSPMRRYLRSTLGLRCPTVTVGHHQSHAAAGYFTSPFRDATIIVLDAIGEWQTYTVWSAEGLRLKLRFSQSYPHSVGLWYSAMTQRCGFKPNEEEYILMGLAAFGEPDRYRDRIMADLVHWDPQRPQVWFKRNLHRGCRDWAPEITDVADLAAATQDVYERILSHVSQWSRSHLPSRNLVLMGGCALNCVANGKIAASGDWDDIWIMPNPGDAGSSVGAVLADSPRFIEWAGPFLGHDIEAPYPVEEALARLLRGEVVGVANGRAEFGPRALGNRSLLADPRIPDAKSKVNQIKRREKFRPFAPAILSERAHEFFDLSVKESPYMQFTARCKAPERFPGVVHVDQTSRVQTVSQKDSPGLHRLLLRWLEETGCPMLLNTSLNIKGEPLVNDRVDALRFSERYGLPVLGT